MNHRLRNHEQGVALVTTVIVVAVLAVVAVAFMQSTTVDRQSSRSVANYTRAKLATDAGLAAASATLSANSMNDTFVVVLNTTNRQLFIGNGVPGGTDFSYAPLFSVVPGITNAVANVVTSGLPTYQPQGITTNFTNWVMPGGLSVTSPVISWVYLTGTNTAGQLVTNARFAYWVEDLGGRLDLSAVGVSNTANITNARRLSGTNPAEIALWSLFNTNSASDPGNSASTSLAAARSNILTPATARLVDTAVTSSLLADLAADLRHDTNEPEIIPFGFGYADQGEPKLNLNTSDFAAVVGAINAGLTNFGERGGGLPAADYVNNIAANIVDFIDADAVPTTGGGYRGVEAIPFLNERMTRFVLQGPPVNAGKSRWEIRIETTEYFEFWNLHSRTSPATTLNFAFTNNQPLNYSGVRNFSIATNYSLSIPEMPPGSYFVASSPTITNVFSVTAFASPSTNPICILIGNSRTVDYNVSAGGIVYDRGCGSHYSDTPLKPGDLTYFSASYPGLGSKANIAGVSDGDFLNAVGDPRSTFYMVNGGQPRPQIQPSWANGNTSFGGRTFQSGMSTARLSKEVRMQNWGDGGHSGTAGSRGSGTTPPATGLFVSNEGDFAPAAANTNTSGRIGRVTDLSAIFDPLQWGEANQSSAWPSEPGAWTNLTRAATANTAYGGGHTLRIGRPEFTRFTNAGTRAAQLLDLLAASSLTNAESGTLLNPVRGRININTAGTNALRALAAGVVNTNDPLAPQGNRGGSGFVVPVAAVDGFVTGVINFRSQRPFYSASQLPLIMTNSDSGQWPANAVFGNRALLGITAGNDAVTEEWFSRVYPLATVRSRNFLVHVIGQALQTNGTTVLSSARRAFQVYFEPVRATNGATAGRTTNCTVRVLGSWEL